MPQGDDYVEYAVSKYADMVLRIAVQNIKNKFDAEDAVQEVFLQLMRCGPREPENEEHLKNWLIRVTINSSKTTENPHGSKKRFLSTTTLPPTIPCAPPRKPQNCWKRFGACAENKGM